MKNFLIFFIFLTVLISGCSNNSSSGLVAGNSSNTIEIKGSDTLLQLSSNLVEEFSKQNPDIRISVTGGGSGTGIAALLNGEVQLANSSRAISEEELKQAQKLGLELFEMIIAHDTLSIVIHEDNPVVGLTLDQISKIYSGEITNWNQIGGENKEIILYGRQSTSGTYTYFLENVIKKEYSAKMRNLEGNQAILDALKQDKTGIGYVGIGYLSDDQGKTVDGIKIVRVAQEDGAEFISPLDETSLSKYPISRPLLQYLREKPLKGSFLHKLLVFELGEDGQEIVKQTGFVPITDKEKEYNNMMLE